MDVFINNFSISEIQYFNHYLLNESHIFTGHRHDCWELNVVLNGGLQVTYDDTVFTLKPGEAFIGHPNIFHYNQLIKQQTVELIVIHFTTNDLPLCFSPQVFSLHDENLLLFKLLLHDLEQFCHSHDVLPPILKVIPYTSKKLFEVFISRILEERIPVPHMTQKDTLIYNTAVTYMKNNLHRNCSIADIATHCCVCNTSLKNTFRKYAGKGVIAFFIELKLESSKTYLQHDYSIAEVSNILGFTSQAYFSRIFKKNYGYSPMKYKNISK